MSYKSLLAHVQLRRSNVGLTRIAGDLAERFDAAVIGAAVCQPMRIVYSDGYVPGDFIQRDREEREKEIAAAEAEFRAALGARVKRLDWRGTLTDHPLSAWLARQASGADLVITGIDHEESVLDGSRHMDTGDLVMHAGRPVLVVPDTARDGAFRRVLVGWKDTRETRRAIADALPLLRLAETVLLAEIAPPSDLDAARDRLAGVASWLALHGVIAETLAMPSGGEDVRGLQELVIEHGMDLLVAGAYGHSRVREWVLGGVTRDLLLRAKVCALVSH